MPREDDPLLALIQKAGLIQADIAHDVGERHVAALNAMLKGTRSWRTGLRDKVEKMVMEALEATT